ncbi:hypothetical protein GCM10009096_33410 [Parasphingorhabdus litoris]|uniref:Uncharacterized protein n=1 Tax=Parasphingorhabdus litoris TaxID=394733 RepID=A0ABP3KXQ1_9SPHN|nr:hypothetical protein [Parasphingorhabdus litoris]
MNILVRTAMVISLSASAVHVPSALALEEGTVEETEKKKPKKITDRRHPDYVRCRSEPIIGSLSRKRRICMTNAQWVAYKRKGSQDSKQFVEDSQPGFMATPN